RSVGSGFRIGRLLGGTPEVSIDDALAIADSDAQRYVRVTGRISSDEEFPDDQNRPIVFRRTRLAVRGAADRWVNALDEREAVPFGVETRSSYIAVDDAALGDGLVVIARESAGRVSDLPADFGVDLPAGANPAAAARLTIEQLSAVEQATVVGQPISRDGVPMMTAGLGRPLIVTTLEQPAAMRVLAQGKRGRVVFATAALAVGIGLVCGAAIAFLLGA
ncbi:MAG: hypothetical protein ACR2H0_04965, partial [Candidatus Limnocylindrales bacterium]